LTHASKATWPCCANSALAMRHAEQDSLMLQRAHDALVPRTLRISEQGAKLITLDRTSSRRPQLIREDRERRVDVLRVETMRARSKVNNAYADLFQVSFEERRQRAWHRAYTDELLPGRVRHFAEESERERMAQETGQVGVGGVDPPMPEVRKNCIKGRVAVILDLNTSGCIRESVVHKLGA
jgi:hypothetical protein